MSETWPWLTLMLLGAYHGLNPAMGWLFAVALGLQERRLRAVLQALPAIALGHALAILLTILVIGLAQVALEAQPLRFICAGALILFGFRDLTVWSFLMATAHGAGLMLIPVLLGLSPTDAHAAHAAPGGSATGSVGQDMIVVGVHTLTMFVVMAVVAVVVYKKLGLALLRRAWFNLDLLWAGALIVAGAVMLVV